MPITIGSTIQLIALVLVFGWILRSMLTGILNAAVDRAINQAVRRLTTHDDERLYDATRQIVCDGIRRAIKAEREDAEVDRLLDRQTRPKANGP